MSRDDPSELREEADEYDALADALEDLRDEVTSNPVDRTRLAGLFEEASTSRPDVWNTVTAFVDVEDGDAIVTDESKLAEGKWAPEIVEGCDAMLTVDVRRGWTPDAFTSTVRQKLDGHVEDARRRAETARNEADEVERADDR